MLPIRLKKNITNVNQIQFNMAEKLYNKICLLLNKSQEEKIKQVFQKHQETSEGKELIENFVFYLRKYKKIEPTAHSILNLIEPYLLKEFSQDELKNIENETNLNIEEILSENKNLKNELKKLQNIIVSIRDIMLSLGTKKKETLYFLNQVNPPIPKWKTPKEKKATGTNNTPNNPFDFYQEHYADIQEYMTQAILKQYNPELMDSIRGRVERLSKKGENISIRNIVPAQEKKTVTKALIQSFCNNLQINSDDFCKIIQSISNQCQKIKMNKK